MPCPPPFSYISYFGDCFARIFWTIFVGFFVGDGLFLAVFCRSDFGRMILLLLFLKILLNRLGWERMHWRIFWTIFGDVFFGDCDFSGIFGRPHFGWVNFLDSFESVLLKIVSRRYDFIAVPVSCFLCCLNFFDHFFDFWIFSFCEIDGIWPTLRPPSPPLVSCI